MAWTPLIFSKLPNRFFSFGAVGALVLFGCTFFFFGHSTQTVVVHYTDRGFEPREIHVLQGDTVVFVNDTDHPFWPASDAHPSHGLYPDFDAKSEVAPGASWEFTFTKSGVWKFHDHLSARHTGKIVVEGWWGNTTADCVLQSTDTIQPQCWEAELDQLIAAGGLDAAFDAVRTWYQENDVFKRNCHDVMHLVGEAAYSLYLKDATATDRSEVAYCGYGFFHGFVETMLAEEGFQQFSRVRQYCESLENDALYESVGPCYHGIGHAAFDSLEGSLWGDAARMTNVSVAVCEQFLDDEFSQSRCASGVYNALANALSARTYELTFDGWVAYDLCRHEKGAYQTFCYMELGNGYIRDFLWSREKEVAYLKVMPAAARIPTLVGYMDTEVRRYIDTLSPVDFAGLCRDFDKGSDRDACAEGALIGLRGISEPGREREASQQFCRALGTTDRSYCLIGELD